MPIYEYRCEACGAEFETLVLGKTEPSCPSCAGTDLKRVFSLPAVQSSSTRALSMKAARKREKARGKERMIAQHEYEQAHED